MPILCLLGLHAKWGEYDVLGIQKCSYCGYARMLQERQPKHCFHVWKQKSEAFMNYSGDEPGITRFIRYTLQCTKCGDIKIKDGKP